MLVKKNNQYFAVPNKNFVIIWAPRAACSNVLTMYFQYLNLIEKINIENMYGKETRETLNVHKYYGSYINRYKEVTNNYIKNNSTRYVQFTVNPYRRAVSIYVFLSERLLVNGNYSFNEFLSEIINNKYQHDHATSQVSILEKNIKYIKMENIEKNIESFNKEYNVNFVFPTKKQKHHTFKTEYKEKIFIGNIKYSEIKEKIPKDYSLFYNDEVKKKVEKIYSEDIEKLNYTWDEFVNTIRDD